MTKENKTDEPLTIKQRELIDEKNDDLLNTALIKGFKSGLYFALKEIVYYHKTPTDVIIDERIVKEPLLASDIEDLLLSHEEENEIFYQLTKDIRV